MWTKSENSDLVKPLEYEESGNNIIVRRAFRQVEASEEAPAHWQYDEWQMTKEQYDVFEPLNAVIHDQSDALCELAELIAEVV